MTIITNTRTKKTLTKDIRTYASVHKKALGLMFRLNPPKFTVVFPFNKPQKVAIHMLFVFFPLDILWLNENKVIDAKTLKPWTFHTPKKKATTVLELPEGTIKRTQTRIKDTLKFS